MSDVIYRAIIAVLIAALGWYFANADAAVRKSLELLTTLVNATRDIALEVRADNRLQDAIIDLINRQIGDHEVRLRNFETWQRNVLGNGQPL